MNNKKDIPSYVVRWFRSAIVVGVLQYLNKESRIQRSSKKPRRKNGESNEREHVPVSTRA